MSNWRDQMEEGDETAAIVDWLLDYYQYPVVLALVAFAFWNRIRNYTNFVSDGNVLFGGNDPWYHLRTTEYSVQNFPETMPFDPWTFFPHGTDAGQFGTFYDQIIAFGALVVGLGDPSTYTTRMVFLVAPAFFAVAVALLAYLIGRRLGGRFGGIVATMFVAFAPDRLLQISLAGNAQHHTAEVVFMGLSVLAVMVALSVAERDLPVYDLVQAREYGPLRPTIGWSMLAGVAMGLYLWAWPPAVLLYGILAVFFVVHLSAEHVRGRSPEHSAFVGVVAFGTAGVLQLGMVRTVELSATNQSLLQPGMGIAIAAGIAFLAWLSREVHDRGHSPYTYPGAIAGAIVVVAALTALLLPGLFDFFLNEVDRVLGFVTSPGTAAGTIGEAQPGDLEDDIIDVYRFGTFTALIGAAIVLVRQVLDERPPAEQLLVVVLSAFLVAATLTQIRFGYYLTLAIGGLNAVLVGWVMGLVGTPDRDSLPETYQILTVAAIVFVVFVPLSGLPLVGGGETATSMADNHSQPGNVVGWSDSLDWMSENTPQPGQYGNPDGEAMDYYGQYQRTDDFDYPDGAYGVLSWWDYGHWITAEGERIADANPFQQNVRPAAEFLLAQNESAALSVLEEDLDDSENAQTRYVMVDSLMVESETAVGGKTFAPAQFHDDYEPADLFRTVVSDSGVMGTVHTQEYYQSMMARLYHTHGSATQPGGTATTPNGEVMVVNWLGDVQVTDDGFGIVSAAQDQEANPLLRFEENLSAARDAVEGDPSSQIGGIGPHPESKIPALDHFRLVHNDEVPAVPGLGGDDQALQEALDRGLTPGMIQVAQRNLGLLNRATDIPFENGQVSTDFLYDNTPAFTKTFERVPGATIEGTVDETNVTAETATLTVDIDPANGAEFTYTQQVDVVNGEFTATVPYSTVDYDEWGVEEGYTNVSARANGAYQIRTNSEVDDGTGERVFYTGTVNVTEGQVIGEDTSPATVTLEEQRVDTGAGNGGQNGSENGGENGTENGGENGTENGGENGSENGGQNGTENGGGNETRNGGENSSATGAETSAALGAADA